MATPKSKEVVTKEAPANAVATVAPSFMKGDAGLGTEQLQSSDLEIPRLVLLQSLSKQVVAGDERAGVFYHTILEEQVGEKGQPLRVVPIYADIKYILWRPRHEGGGILARAEKQADGKFHWNIPNASFDVKPYKDRPTVVKWETKNTIEDSGLGSFGSSDPNDPNSQPAAVKMWNFVVVLPDFPHLGPMVLTLQRGAAKVGANFSAKLKFDGSGAPSFGQVFNVSSKVENSGSGDFYNMSFERSGYVTEEADYLAYKELYKRFSENGVQIKDLEGAQDENGSTASRGAAPVDHPDDIPM